MLEASQLCLRFVPLDRLLVHEETDPFRVKRLTRALEKEGKLRNPPVVSQHDDRYIVLDGATRTAVLRRMGFRDALVQVVDSKSRSVELGAWHHVIVGLKPTRFLSYLNNVPGLALSRANETKQNRQAVSRDIVARILLQDGREFMAPCPGEADCQAELLCQMVAVYRGRAEVHRTTLTDLTVLTGQFPHLTAVVLFPVFKPDEIIHIALSGSRVPMGITRHIIAGRALGLGVPLTMLTADQTLEAKNTWLSKLIHQRLQTNKVRLYEEPVYVFDD